MLSRYCTTANPHNLLQKTTTTMLAQMLVLHFVAIQKACELIAVIFKSKFPLNIPEKVDLKIHWQVHSSRSRSGSPPE